MLLVLDIGNTETTIGLYDGPLLRGHWRMTTLQERTPDEWGIALEAFILRAGHAPAEIRSACLASVAPTVTHLVTLAIGDLGITNMLELRPELAMRDIATTQDLVRGSLPGAFPVRLDVDEPLSVGADRIANVVAAIESCPGGAIVVDFGTATTFDCVTADRSFIGGAIMPGLRTSADHLIRKASKLAATELIAPARAIGRRTDDNIRSGVLFGTADAVDGMLRRIRSEWPSNAIPKVLATGGLASTITPLTAGIDQVDPDLTLRGLRLVALSLGMVE